MLMGLPPDYRILEVDNSADAILRNLFEHYLHDMAEWFGFESQQDGAYHFPTETVWDAGYDVYLLYWKEIPIGFGLVGSADKFLDRTGVNDMDEFFVARKHRRRGVGRAFATELWNAHPGTWLVRVFQANLPAMPFWREAIAARTKGRFDEDVRTVNAHPWSYFTFSTEDASK